MAPRKFRLSRVQRILLEDPTGTVELIVGLCFVLVPGLALAMGWSDLPPATVRLFSVFGVSEQLIGWVAVVFGIAQLWGAGTEWYTVRAAVATGLGMMLASVIVSYFVSGYGHRPHVVWMAGTILAQMFVSWRCWHEKPNASERARETKGVDS